MATQPVTIRDFKYEPEKIEIAAGDTVVWTNLGKRAHTVTSDTTDSTGAPTFDSEDILAGETFSREFSGQPSSIDYHCSHHAAMKGRIVVR
jgi:plastocyanin